MTHETILRNYILSEKRTNIYALGILQRPIGDNEGHIAIKADTPG